MIFASLIKDLGKIFGVICVFFLISGAYFLLKPTEEDKYLDQQMKMYPLGFHCTDDDGGEQVLKFDSKSQVAVYKDVYKYSMGKALYHGDDKIPFGCEFLITGNGEKRIVLVYASDDGPVNLEDVRYEQNNDKDLIYTVVGKSLKNNENIRYRNMGEL
jgi:hypothetical protein